ncbi:MAG: alkaline phosphatase family protein [Victivallaceae bacterium]|nr:alkaline phosphatase family protein [Victivallaceae bacterium]
MTDSVHVFIYLTGPGWYILKEHGFLEKHCRHQFPVRSQLGCSHAALLTALTGKTPDEHGHFSSYYFQDKVTLRETVRRLYRKLLGEKSGYFGTYSIPMRNLKYFISSGHPYVHDLSPGCFAPLTSIIDMVQEKNLAHSIVGAQTGSPVQALKNVRNQLQDRSLNFAFIEINEMDELLHSTPHDFYKIDKKLRNYEHHIEKIISVGREVSSDFNLTVFSGHGMTFAPQRINIRKKIEALGMNYGLDYHAVYDPTMAFFWFKSKFARSIILDRLQELRHCKILSENEKKEYGIDFPDRRYGETMVLVEPGFQICPNDVLSCLPAGMHGYAPDHPDSLGACLSTRPIYPGPTQVKDFFNIMTNFVSGCKQG